MGHRASTQNEHQVFSQLKNAGLRATSARVCVLQLLHDNRHASLSVESVYLSLASSGVITSLGTVYRVLHELEEKGLVQRERDAGHVAAKSHFVLSPLTQRASTYAFVCRSCASRYQVEDKLFMETMQRQARVGGFELGLQEAYVSTLCNRCKLDQGAQ